MKCGEKMKPEIKQRIEQIKAGQVPAGYKKTKVGIVPTEWVESKLSHYLTVNNDKNEDLEYGKEDVFSISGELGVVNQIELLGRSYAGASVAPYGIVYPNDVVYTKSPLKVNPYGIIKTNKTGNAGIVSTLYAIFHCKDNVCPDFVQLYFESDNNLNNYLYPIVNIGAKHDMKISDENSLKGYVVFPPLAEQEKIAEILSVQDKIIELKEKLCEEKKKQKKYLMQQILNDKTVRTKFSSHWETVELQDIFEYIQPTKYLVESTDYSKMYHTPVLTAGKSFILGYTNETKGIYEQVPVVIFDDFTTDSKYVDFPFKVKSSAMKILKAKDNYDIRFAFELLQNINYIVGGHERHWISIFSQFTVDVPPYEVQLKISNIIQMADKEIELFQKELDQEKQKKKALMQLLLTGIVRV